MKRPVFRAIPAAAFGIPVAAMILAAPLAHAQTDIEDKCKASGGQYTQSQVSAHFGQDAQLQEAAPSATRPRRGPTACKDRPTAAEPPGRPSVGRVDGKVALITGGARGMGAEHARLLLREGAKVVIGDVLDDEGHAVARELGDGAHYLPLDVTQPEQWASAVAETVRRFGKLDVLVNNAGVSGRKTVRKFELERWRHTLDVNLTGTFLGTQAVVDEMIKAGGGSIINISSIEGLRGAPFAHAYVASKWAVRGLTKSTALELGRYNIRVNSVHPGLVRTPMTAHFPDDIVRSALGRPAEPIEVSNFVLFLASDESSYSTGAEFVVDGGVTADTPRKDLS